MYFVLIVSICFHQVCILCMYVRMYIRTYVHTYVCLYVIVVMQAQMYCLICTHNTRGHYAPKRECGDIRQCKRASVTINMLHFQHSKNLPRSLFLFIYQRIFIVITAFLTTYICMYSYCCHVCVLYGCKIYKIYWHIICLRNRSKFHHNE